ncbi:MAG: peptidase, partial [Cyanobacteria bacterium RYN_339]|nr:peptidase [Cyanobacteria bacterium RYN_339]
MKYFAIAAAALTLTACGQPTAPTVPATPTRANYRLADAPAGTALLVRYKDGQEGRHGLIGFQGNTFGLARAYRYPVANAAARATMMAKFQADPAVEVVEPDYRMYTYATPTDPSYGQQWDMAKIQLGAALDVTPGKESALVACVDSGVDYNHPDLAGQVAKGHDFVNNDDDPMDDNGHGSHTAGTVAARTNNGTGIAGVAGGCKVLAVKVMDANGGGDVSNISAGIDYAVKAGAKVINLSLGAPQESQILHAAVQQAVKAGVVVVAAAGNDGSTTRNYPAAYPEVLSVGATDENDARANFSTFGSWVKIAAPGTHILSTFKGAYKQLDGTSMASPHVAGAAALVRSLHPEWTVDQVCNALITSGDACTGFESAPSLRRLNVAKALGATAAAPVAADPAPVAADPAP